MPNPVGRWLLEAWLTRGSGGSDARSLSCPAKTSTATAVALVVVIFGGAIVLLGASHAKSSTYHCPNCPTT